MYHTLQIIKWIWIALIMCTVLGKVVTAAQPPDACSSHQAPYRVEFGVNRMNIGRAPDWKQTIDGMVAADVKSVRMNIKGDGDNYINAINYAHSRGLDILLVIPLTEAWFHSADSAQLRDKSKVRAAYGLSSLDENKYRNVLAKMFDELDSRDIRISRIEIGNEINWSGFNSDLPTQRKGQVVTSLQQLGARETKVLEGFRNYRSILQTTRSILTSSKKSPNAKIVSAGLMSTGSIYGLTPWLESSGGTQLTIGLVNAIYDDLGISRLVDIRGIHIYPQDLMKTREGNRFAEIRSVINDAARLCSPHGETCLITEWGFNADRDQCWDEDPREKLFRDFLSAASCSKELAGAWVFTWDDSAQKAVYRCGQAPRFGGALRPKR